MRRDDAMDALPDAYRTALELRDEGIELRDIAARLDIDLVAMEALLAIGEEKLARLLAEQNADAGADVT